MTSNHSDEFEDEPAIENEDGTPEGATDTDDAAERASNEWRFVERLAETNDTAPDTAEPPSGEDVTDRAQLDETDPETGGTREDATGTDVEESGSLDGDATDETDTDDRSMLDDLLPTERRGDVPVRREVEDDDPVAAVRTAILDDVESHFVAAAGSADDPSDRRELVTQDDEIPSRSFIEEDWFEFGYLDEYELVEWEWTNRPYSYVSILYDPNRKTYRYHVTEPILDAFEQYVRDDLMRIIRNSLMYEDIDGATRREEVFADKVADVIEEHAATVNAGTVQKLYYYFMRDFIDFGRIDPLMCDPGIEDISCDGVDVPVYIYHRRYRDLRTNISFEAKQLNSMAVKLAQRAGKHISVSNPLVDASLADGSRIQLTLGSDISSRGSNFTIRKFTDVPYTPIDLIKWNTFSLESMAYFWLAIENNKSLIFAGGTGSGKTTSLNAVSFFIPPDSKVVSIEDTREITLPHENWIQSVTRESATSSGQGEITTYELLQASLRQRPEYLLVGEIRTEQRVALTFFQAIGTGHTAYTTVHADSMESVMARLRNPPLSVPAQMVQNLDIVSIQRQVFDGEHRVRRNEEIAELVSGSTGDDVQWRTLFERDPTTDTYDQVAESSVLTDIARQRGWTDDEVMAELTNREEILGYLVRNDITEYDTVADTIHAYSRDPEGVLAQIRDDDLRPKALLAAES